MELRSSGEWERIDLTSSRRMEKMKIYRFGLRLLILESRITVPSLREKTETTNFTDHRFRRSDFSSEFHAVSGSLVEKRAPANVKNHCATWLAEDQTFKRWAKKSKKSRVAMR
ncbi:hypothetical protein B9Z55_005631 [Caenorhabditis nigoni]|nr:hypothetical protein B9Z55_005631 [Caenorhabditis nigoni]